MPSLGKKTIDVEYRIMKNFVKKCENGLTLVEMLTAVSIIVIMGGSAYAVFNTAIKAYHRTQSKVLQAQRCRVVMDQLVTDLSQLQADTSDEMLAIYSEDLPTASGDRDIISFVTLVKTDPAPFVIQQSTFDASLTPPLSDVRRVAYYIGPKISIEERQTQNIVPPPYMDSQEPGQNMTEEPERLALYRIVTTSLNPELVVRSFMDTGTIPQVDENGVEIDFRPDLLIDGIINFDLKYIDEESIYDSWEQTDAIPLAVQILLSVVDEDREDRQERIAMPYAQQTPGTLVPGALTQSTMVYLQASTSE